MGRQRRDPFEPEAPGSGLSERVAALSRRSSSGWSRRTRPAPNSNTSWRACHGRCGWPSSGRPGRADPRSPTRCSADRWRAAATRRWPRPTSRSPRNAGARRGGAGQRRDDHAGTDAGRDAADALCRRVRRSRRRAWMPVQTLRALTLIDTPATDASGGLGDTAHADAFLFAWPHDPTAIPPRSARRSTPRSTARTRRRSTRRGADPRRAARQRGGRDRVGGDRRRARRPRGRGHPLDAQLGRVRERGRHRRRRPRAAQPAGGDRPIPSPLLLANEESFRHRRGRAAERRRTRPPATRYGPGRHPRRAPLADVGNISLVAILRRCASCRASTAWPASSTAFTSEPTCSRPAARCTAWTRCPLRLASACLPAPNASETLRLDPDIPRPRPHAAP